MKAHLCQSLFSDRDPLSAQQLISTLPTPFHSLHVTAPYFFKTNGATERTNNQQLTIVLSVSQYTHASFE
jgi:hypothetical protein